MGVKEMSNGEKIKKLANAIKRYRGAYNSRTKVWIRRPEQGARSAVVICLERLGLTENEMALIDGFASFDQFYQWLEGLR